MCAPTNILAAPGWPQPPHRQTAQIAEKQPPRQSGIASRCGQLLRPSRHRFQLPRRPDPPTDTASGPLAVTHL